MNKQKEQCIESRVGALKPSEIFGAVLGEVRAFRRPNGGRGARFEPARQASLEQLE